MVSQYNFDSRSSYYFCPTSIWYQSLTSIRDQVISICFKFLIRYQNFLFIRFGTILCVTKFTNSTIFNPFHYSLYLTTLLGLLSDQSIAPARSLTPLLLQSTSLLLRGSKSLLLQGSKPPLLKLLRQVLIFAVITSS